MGDVRADAKDVRFDYDGALQLARALWTYADTLSGVKPGRATDVDTALKLWTGPKAREFKTAASDEISSMNSFVTALRAEAKGWAKCWKDAFDLQNNINWARANEKKKSDRSGMETFSDNWNPFDSGYQPPPKPEPVAQPASPDFYATAYSFYSWDGDAA